MTGCLCIVCVCISRRWPGHGARAVGDRTGHRQRHAVHPCARHGAHGHQARQRLAEARQRGRLSCVGWHAWNVWCLVFPSRCSAFWRLVPCVVGFWFTHKPRASFPSGKDKHCPPWLGWGHCTVVCKDRQIGYSRSTACYTCYL